jgi:ribosomal protein S3
MKYSSDGKDVVRRIGYFFLQKNKMDCRKTRQEIERLGITRIEYHAKDTLIKIELARPGILIGRKGLQLQALLDFLKQELPDNIPVSKIETDEDNLTDFLIPEDYSYYWDVEWDW